MTHLERSSGRRAHRVAVLVALGLTTAAFAGCAPLPDSQAARGMAGILGQRAAFRLDGTGVSRQATQAAPPVAGPVGIAAAAPASSAAPVVAPGAGPSLTVESPPPAPRRGSGGGSGGGGARAPSTGTISVEANFAAPTAASPDP